MSIKELIAKFGISVTYLNPSSLNPNNYKSKIGGKETYVLDEIYNCKRCKEQMCLILEIFKTDFDEFYFPDNLDYAQVKTCYNENCTYDENYDIEFHLSYGDSKNLQLNTKTSDTSLLEIYLNPIKTFEIPYNTYETKEQLAIIEEMNLEEYENIIDDYVAKIGTKLNGDIFSWHPNDIPICECGNKKNHILQISSYEPNVHPNENRPYYQWDSSIGVYG